MISIFNKKCLLKDISVLWVFMSRNLINSSFGIIEDAML
jgi:hypothetical protein